MKKNEKIYIDFSLDYNGDIECIDELIKDGDDDISGDVPESQLNDFVEKLKEVEGFNVSDHRTQIRLWIYDDNTMDVYYQFFNEPEDGEFADIELIGIPSIELDIKIED